jgi:hypothetical protein
MSILFHLMQEEKYIDLVTWGDEVNITSDDIAEETILEKGPVPNVQATDPSKSAADDPFFAEVDRD